MKLKTVYTLLLSISFLFFIDNSISAQCETWNAASNQEELENLHQFYQGEITKKDYAKAYEYWAKVFKAAPAANGKVAAHYSDGRIILSNLFKAETDATKRTELTQSFLDLYDKEYDCFPKDRKGKDKKGYLLENKVYELYYTFNYQRDVIFDAVKEAAKLNGNNLGYSVIYPYADIACTFFTDKRIEAEEAREIHKNINEVCDFQIAKKDKYSPYYQQQKDLANQRFDAVADQLFGCAYHLEKIKPEYDANPNDKATYTRVYEALKVKGCTSAEPLMNEIYAKIQKDRALEREEKKKELAEKKAAWEANNPAVMAQKAYKSGDYATAISKYNEAIEQATDDAEKAEYHYYLAVTYRDKKEYSKAKKHAQRSTSLDSSFGKAYLFLGDLYARLASRCSKDPFEQRMGILAAIDKWSKAKAVSSNSQVQSSAQKNINNYSNQYPTGEMVFLKGKKEGQYYTVGCGIGESTKIRAKN